MKRTRILMMAYVAMLAGLTFVSCQKEDSNNASNGNNNSAGSTPEGWVNLDLPSGLLWAECNLGASSPEEYGNYYAWGETTTKEVYDWSTYRYSNGNGDNNNSQLTKYCSNIYYGYNGYTDNLATLQAMDDAATQALGSGARTPTKEEWQELIANTTVEWTTMNGVNGLKFTSTANGNTLFLPGAGRRDGSELSGAGGAGFYWSSSLGEGRTDYAWYFYFYGGVQNMTSHDRSYGFTVRAVRQN